MHPDPVLAHDWLPVAAARQVAPGQPLAARLLGEDLVLWRNGAQVLAWQDRCPHRGAQLSLGRVEPADGVLVCP